MSFTLGTWLAWAGIVALVAALRGRPFVFFVTVLLGLHSIFSTVIVAELRSANPAHAGALLALCAALQAASFGHFLMLTRPRLRPLAYRALVSIPASFFVSASFLSFPWVLVRAAGVHPPGAWVPFVLAGLGVLQSLVTREQDIDLELDQRDLGPLQPMSLRGGVETASARPLRLIQITDPHLGPMMSVARLRRIAQRAVEREPDLVLLTGDFLTMEAQSEVAHLRDALAPLKALEGRVFACLGNHDHEAPELVRRALSDIGARLLVDAAEVVETPAGPVQVVGFDYAWRDREARMRAVCEAYPRVPGALRLALLHDPGAFKLLGPGESDLVLSGHTHGGQVGLVSLGSAWTFLRLLARGYPDHGAWGRGRDRLYVHRGTGLYGFPLRLGVPGEESLLRVHWRQSPA
jgi:predicted MPP superfamily phosphohydrolase